MIVCQAEGQTCASSSPRAAAAPSDTPPGAVDVLTHIWDNTHGGARDTDTASAATPVYVRAERAPRRDCGLRHAAAVPTCGEGGQQEVPAHAARWQHRGAGSRGRRVRRQAGVEAQPRRPLALAVRAAAAAGRRRRRPGVAGGRVGLAGPAGKRHSVRTTEWLVLPGRRTAWPAREEREGSSTAQPRRSQQRGPRSTRSTTRSGRLFPGR